MRNKRWWMLVALVITLGVAGWTTFAIREERAQRAEEEAYTRRLGDALIRQGIALYQKGNYPAAITAWERYLRFAPPHADTQSIREMIGEAQRSATARSSRAQRTRQSTAGPLLQ